MTHALFDCTNIPYAKVKVLEFPSYADAVAHAKIHYEIAVFCEDMDAVYQAADFLTKRGRQYAIEPINMAAQ